MPKSKRRKRSKNKSGYIGVYQTHSGKYQARISINGKLISIGSSYDTAKQAAKAHDKEAIKLRRPFSKLNYPKKAPVGYTPIQQPLRSTNTVGYRGVSKMRKKFQASIKINGKQQHIGVYDTSKKAAIAYDRAVLKANISTSLLNFPDMVHNLDVEPKRRASNNKSGYRGMRKTPSGKFQACIHIAGHRMYIGTFDTASQAALAYDQAAIKAGRKKSSLNFPDGLSIKQEDPEAVIMNNQTTNTQEEETTVKLELEAKC